MARIAGRVGEQKLLRTVIGGAATQQPCAVFVHGEAGVGKTSLVQAVCDDAVRDLGATVLWGRCVHFGAASSPYAPIVSALDSFLSTASAPVRDSLLAEVESLDDVFAAEAAEAHRRSGRVLQVIDRVIGRIAADSPALLVIDDLQWADVTSLDVLAYLVTGFRSQRLAVVATFRDDGLAEGHPLHGWLADLHRLPFVVDLPLGRLDEQATRKQLEGLLGAPPSRALLREVFDKSGGNAYLSELLVRDLEPGTTTLPPGLPNELRGVLLATWHGLSAATRDMLRLLAVGGRPFGYAEFLSVAEVLDRDPAVVSGALAEAAHAGVVTVEGDSYWFRHPLLAEVLYDSFLPGEAEPLHAAFVNVLESSGARDEAELIRHLGDLALHEEMSGNPDDAVRYSLQAAEFAARLQGYPEEARHLRRVVQLWGAVGPEVRDSIGSEVDLLQRAATASRRSGDVEAAYRLVTRALGLVRREEDPQTASRVLLAWCDLVYHSGRVSQMPLAQAIEAVELSSADVDGEDYAKALANLAQSEAWAGMTRQARENAELAVAAAEQSGSPSAMARALNARSFVFLREPRALADAEAAHRFARESGDPVLIGEACRHRTRFLEERGRMQEALAVEAEGFAVCTATGMRSMAAMFAGSAALNLIWRGELRASREWIREGLAARADTLGAAVARQAAATFALRVGRVEDARDHIERIHELSPAFESHSGYQGPSVLAEYLIADSRPAEALETIVRTMPSHAADRRFLDVMLIWGARAAAALAERARDDRDSRGAAAARRMLDKLVELRREAGGEPFEQLGEQDLVQPACQAVFAAEVARCRGTADEVEQWEAAVGACRRAGMRYDEGLALWRLAVARTVAGSARDGIRSAARAAHEIAVQTGADLLREEVEALARSARISLERPVVPPQGTPASRAPNGLTRRELEVIGHLVAGRSYTEIARALFISDKTVSVHVSNILRKTGTVNRVEAAAYARRHGIVDSGGVTA